MDIFSTVKRVIHDTLGVPLDAIQNTSTPDDLNLCSLDVTEVIMAIEEEFDIVIENDDCFHTVDDLVHIVSAA